MFGSRKAEIFKSKDKAAWKKMKEVLNADGTVRFKSGHYLQETVMGGGCGAKLDPRDFGSKGKIDREIYWIRVDEADDEKAKKILLKNGLTPLVADNITKDAAIRQKEAQEEFFK